MRFGLAGESLSLRAPRSSVVSRQLTIDIAKRNPAYAGFLRFVSPADGNATRASTKPFLPGLACRKTIAFLMGRVKSLVEEYLSLYTH